MVDFSAVAHYWAAKGYRVFPLYTPDTIIVATGKPAGTKRPQIRHWQVLATTDAGQIDKWAVKWPHAGVGICTTSLVAIDVDGPAGHAALESLQAQHGKLPDTLTFTSPSDPTHYKFLYRLPPGVEIKSSAGKLAPKVDVKGWHSFVVAGGSYHGESVVQATNEDSLAEIPGWLLALLEQRPTKSTPLQDDPKSHDYLIDILIEKYPIGHKTRHSQTGAVSSYLAVREELTPIERVAIGSAWLRRQEERYETPYEQAVVDLKESLRTTTPFRFDLSTIELPDYLRRIVDSLDCHKQRSVLTVIFQQWLWNWCQQTGNYPNSISPTNSSDSSLFTFPTSHHNTGFMVLCQKELSSTTLEITTDRLLAGYKKLTGKSPDKRTIIKLKSHFITLPTLQGKETGSTAAFELFVRTEIGRPGKGSSYQASPQLIALLTQEQPSVVSSLHSNATAGSVAPASSSCNEKLPEDRRHKVCCPACRRTYYSKLPVWQRRTMLCKSCGFISRVLKKEEEPTAKELEFVERCNPDRIDRVVRYLCPAGE